MSITSSYSGSTSSWRSGGSFGGYLRTRWRWSGTSTLMSTFFNFEERLIEYDYASNYKSEKQLYLGQMRSYC